MASSSNILSLGISPAVISRLSGAGIIDLNPVQVKAVSAGVLSDRNILVCSPTASGKTLIAELAISKAVDNGLIAVYIVPLVALASEKFKSFSQRYSGLWRVGLFVGKSDDESSRISGVNVIVCTSEKLDSILRHNPSWISRVGVVVADEVHLMNDPGRGPTLEVVLTLLRFLKKDIHIVALSATIGNAVELSEWLGATLVKDDWRPVKLLKGIAHNGSVEFFE